MIEDFFRLVSDAVRYYPRRTITSNLAIPTFSASLSALSLQQIEPVTATLHYCRDLLSFGFDKPAISQFTSPDGEVYANPPEIKAAVKQLMASQGPLLVQRVMTGMMFSFPEECFADASGVLMSVFELLPHEAARWLDSTIQLLPVGTLKQGEIERLMGAISERIDAGDHRKTRVLLQGKFLSQSYSLAVKNVFLTAIPSLTDFTNTYRRRNVAPREGLGRLEAARFRFSG